MTQPHPSKLSLQSRLNWLRAAVLGANDGIVSVAALIVGVASAFSDGRTIMVTGAAGLIAGALSMAVGEFVSVSTQRDAEKSHHELSESSEEKELTNPWHAAIASLLSFAVGGLIPLLAVTLSPAAYRLPITYVAVLIALIITGILSARATKSSVVKVTLRVIIGGALAMLITTGIGKLFGIAGY